MKYFSKFQSFEHQIIILAPKERFESVKSSCTQKVFQYDTVESILKIIRSIRPDIIIFFSAYLFVINRIFTMRSFKRLLDRLKELSIISVTTEPFLGYLETIKPSKINLHILSKNPKSIISKSCAIPSNIYLFYEFKLIRKYLKNFIHIYPVPIEKISIPALVQAKSFFNTKLILNINSIRLNKNSSHDENVNQRKSWVYVISKIDLDIQFNTHGETTFIKSLNKKISIASTMNKNVIVIAPLSLTAMLQNNDNLQLIYDINYDNFTQIILEAELAFYWNIFSNSAFIRMMNSMPILFFNAGHIASIFSGSYDVALESCYNNMKPVFIDFFQEPNEIEFELLINQSTNVSQNIYTHLSTSSEPENVLEEIINLGD